MKSYLKSDSENADIKFFAIPLITLLLFSIGFGIWRWNVLDNPYILPRSSQDWAAWATWVGGFAAVFSIWVAIRQLGHAVKAHRESERRREERHEELVTDRDELAIEEARELVWSFHSSQADVHALHAGLPTEEEVLAQKADEQALLEDPSEKEKWEEGRSEGDDPDVYDRKFDLYVRVKNLSGEILFKDLSLQLPVPAERAEIASVEQKPLSKGPEYYRERDDFIDLCDKCTDCQGSNFSFGDLEPRFELVIHLKFQYKQPWMLWAFHDPEYAGPNRGTMHLRYRDSKDRYWLRSTMRNENEVLRHWENPQSKS